MKKPALLPLFFLLSLLPLRAQTESNPITQSLIEQALEKSSEKDYATALGLLSIAAKLSPDNKEIQNYISSFQTLKNIETVSPPAPAEELYNPADDTVTEDNKKDSSNLKIKSAATRLHKNFLLLLGGGLTITRPGSFNFYAVPSDADSAGFGTYFSLDFFPNIIKNSIGIQITHANHINDFTFPELFPVHITKFLLSGRVILGKEEERLFSLGLTAGVAYIGKEILRERILAPVIGLNIHGPVIAAIFPQTRFFKRIFFHFNLWFYFQNIDFYEYDIAALYQFTRSFGLGLRFSGLESLRFSPPSYDRRLFLLVGFSY